METRKRRSRVLLKAVLGTAAGGSNHRRSEESEMSDCSLASLSDAVNSSGIVGDGVYATKNGKKRTDKRTKDIKGTGCSRTQSIPVMKLYETGVSSSLKFPQATPDHVMSHTLRRTSSTSSKFISITPSPILLLPSTAAQLVSGRSSSLESICSDIVPHTPNNTPSEHSYPQPPIKRPSSHPIIHSSMPHLPSNPHGSRLLFADPSIPGVPATLTPFDSRRSSSVGEMEGVAVYDITNTPKAAETKKASLDSQSRLEAKEDFHSIAACKSLSQPCIVVPSELTSKVRKKKHKFVSPMLSVNNSSTDSLTSLQFSVIQPCFIEPLKPKPQRPLRSKKNQVHPEWKPEIPAPTPPEEVPIIQSPSSTSGSSIASRNQSLSESARSSVSLTLGPLLTASLRLRQSRSATDRRLGDIGEIQLESCFPDRNIRLYVVTWNMQERKELPDSLDDLLLPLDHDVAADMFVIGTQESTPSRREWEVLIQKTLGPYYILVQSCSIGVIYLSLFIRRDLIWFCSATSTANFATRPVTIIKTKGAVGLSFTLFGHPSSSSLRTSQRAGIKLRRGMRTCIGLQLIYPYTKTPDSL